MGLKEYIVFLEIDYDKVEKIWGMDIVVCIIVSNDEEVKVLLVEFDFLFLN